MSEWMESAGLEGFDPKLIEEALRRGCEAPVNRDVDLVVILQRILREAKRGTRDMFGLVSAAKKLSDAA